MDRLNSLLQPQKLTTVEMMASHMYASYNKHISLVSKVSFICVPPGCTWQLQVENAKMELAS